MKKKVSKKSSDPGLTPEQKWKIELVDQLSSYLNSYEEVPFDSLIEAQRDFPCNEEAYKAIILARKIFMLQTLLKEVSQENGLCCKKMVRPQESSDSLPD